MEKQNNHDPSSPNTSKTPILTFTQPLPQKIYQSLKKNRTADPSIHQNRTRNQYPVLTPTTLCLPSTRWPSLQLRSEKHRPKFAKLNHNTLYYLGYGLCCKSGLYWAVCSRDDSRVGQLKFRLRKKCDAIHAHGITTTAIYQWIACLCRSLAKYPRFGGEFYFVGRMYHTVR